MMTAEEWVFLLLLLAVAQMPDDELRLLIARAQVARSRLALDRSRQLMFSTPRELQ